MFEIKVKKDLHRLFKEQLVMKKQTICNYKFEAKVRECSQR